MLEGILQLAHSARIVPEVRGGRRRHFMQGAAERGGHVARRTYILRNARRRINILNSESVIVDSELQRQQPRSRTQDYSPRCISIASRLVDPRLENNTRTCT